MKEFKIYVSDWIQPNNMDIWYQRLFVQTASDEQTLGVDLAITGKELRHLGVKHPSEVPRQVALDHVKTMAYTLADHIELTMQREGAPK